MRALVVDDSFTVRTVLRKILEEIKLEVFDAEDGLAALECLKKIGPVELMLIDWNMPNMNGIELIQALRADSIYDSTRLLMVTTEFEMKRVVTALSSGCDEFVMKPFTKESILDKLRMIGITET